MTSQVWVLDSSALIHAKQGVAVDDQWTAFTEMASMVDAGTIAMPRQVIKEVGTGPHPDAPGVWASGMRRRLQQPLDVPPAVLRQVLAAVPDVIERDATDDVADPYVLALALHLSGSFEVTIVTEDVVDRAPLKRSLARAAEMLDLDWCDLSAFMAALGIQCKKKRSK